MRLNYVTRFVLAVVSAVISPVLGTLSAEPIAAHSDKFLGTVVHGPVPSNFNEYWNQVTPENSGKWGNVEPVRDQMNWGGLDTAYNYAKDNGLIFKQHTFVWVNQRPTWLDSLPPQEQREEVEEWIRLYGERYPETDFIDVVNEPLNGPPPFREALGGGGETGFDWVITAFELARTYCPDAKLLINEFNIINFMSNVEAYLGLVNVLKERGLLDGIGIQAHFFSLQWIDTINPPPTVEELNANLDRLGSAGLPIYVSELDVYGNDTTQLEQYQRLFPVFWDHPAIAGITFWGWIENHTWAPNTYLYSDRGERPSLQWIRSYVNSASGSLTDTPYRIAATEQRPFSIRQATDSRLLLQVDRAQALSIRMVDLRGRVVVTLPEAVFHKGVHLIPLDGRGVSPGNYFLTVDGRNDYADFNVTIMK